MPVWVSFSVAILVYEKNGLKRGPGINSAVFRSYPPDQPYSSIISAKLNPPPLAGWPPPPLYKVDIQSFRYEDQANDPFNLSVSAGGFYPQYFPVRDGDSFEVRLQRA